MPGNQDKSKDGVAGPEEDQAQPRANGGQGGSQSGFGGYGAGPGSLERQANRTSPAQRRNKPTANEPED